jgi:copper resistance protein C
MAIRRGWLLATIVIAAIYAGAANAHSMLVKSDPGRRAVIKTVPKEIRLWFNEKLEPAYSSIWLLDSDGKLMTTEQAKVSGDDRKLMMLLVPTLSAGVYQVKYRVLSIDGHAVESSYTFTLKPMK